MTNSELREALAPRVAARLQAQLCGHGMPAIRAEQLAHEVIAMVQSAQDAERLAEQQAELVRLEVAIEGPAVENAVEKPGKIGSAAR